MVHRRHWQIFYSWLVETRRECQRLLHVRTNGLSSNHRTSANRVQTQMSTVLLNRTRTPAQELLSCWTRSGRKWEPAVFSERYLHVYIATHAAPPFNLLWTRLYARLTSKIWWRRQPYSFSPWHEEIKSVVFCYIITRMVTVKDLYWNYYCSRLEAPGITVRKNEWNYISKIRNSDHKFTICNVLLVAINYNTLPAESGNKFIDSREVADSGKLLKQRTIASQSWYLHCTPRSLMLRHRFRRY